MCNRTVAVPKAPVLPQAPPVYNQSYFERILQTLRVYFTHLDNPDVTRTGKLLLTAPSTETDYDAGLQEDTVWVDSLGLLHLKDSDNGVGWRDMLSAVSNAKVPAASAPTSENFGSAGTLQRKEYAFAVNDYIFLAPFHIQHDVKPNSTAYFHVHWATNGTSTNTVKWEIHYQRALGHDQANFGAPTSLSLTQAPAGTAYRHMIIEDATGITLYEPDELILATLKRVTNGGSENTDLVFGLMVDLHYQVDRFATKNKAPDFYA